MCLLSGCGRIDFDVTTDATTDVPPTVVDSASGLPLSCLEHAATGATANGVYSIDIAGVLTDVYCEMTVAGGGWTLVGRTAPSGTPSAFGWKGATGSVTDDTSPYSLGAAELSFTEILVASHAGTKTPVDPIYRVDAAPDFVNAYATQSLRSESATVSGSCTPSPFVTMLLFKGQTDLPGVFWFRDSEFVGGTPHGMFPNAWDTYYPADCLQGGLLHQTQGVIYVR